MCVYLIIHSIFPDTILGSYPSNERRVRVKIVGMRGTINLCVIIIIKTAPKWMMNQINNLKLDLTIIVHDLVVSSYYSSSSLDA